MGKSKMIKTFLGVLVLFSSMRIYADELSEALSKNNASKNNASSSFVYHSFKQSPKQASQVKDEQSIDFQSALNGFLANALEKPNGIDKTDGNLDFENEKAEVKNLNSLYENEYSSLLFQKEFSVALGNYNYSGGLINRYEKDDFLFGINGFIDKQKEQDDIKSFGTELGYGRFIKAYSNYYIPNEAERNLQLGLNFILPRYEAFSFDISKDDEKTDYQVSYAPYNAFHLNLLRRDAKESRDDTLVQVGFSFNFNENFLRQLRKKDRALDGLNRYEFLQRRH